MATKKKGLKTKAPAVDPPKLDQWKKKGKSLAKAKNGNQWAIADWMCKGETDFKKCKPYEVASKATGMTVGTLRQFAHTARNVLTRVNGLSFGPHRLVAEYTPEEQIRLLKQATADKESVASFAAVLKARKKDLARRADKRSPADQAADKVVDACDTLIRSYHFTTLVTDRPSTVKRNELLNKLKKAAADLNNKVEEMARAWREQDAADEAFQQDTVPETKALGVAAK